MSVSNCHCYRQFQFVKRNVNMILWKTAALLPRLSLCVCAAAVQFFRLHMPYIPNIGIYRLIQFWLKILQMLSLELASRNTTMWRTRTHTMQNHKHTHALPHSPLFPTHWFQRKIIKSTKFCIHNRHSNLQNVYDVHTHVCVRALPHARPCILWTICWCWYNRALGVL